MIDEGNYEVLEFLGTILDPRIDRCKKYSLESILFVALVGMLCGLVIAGWLILDDFYHI